VQNAKLLVEFFHLWIKTPKEIERMGDLLQPWHLLVLLLVFGIFFLLPAVFYALTLQRTLGQCAPVSRTMEPGMVWLFLVPFVNLVFHFFIVLAISKSVANEFARRRIPIADPQPGQALGLAMCICACCSLIPILGLVAAIASIVLWIVYWFQVGEFSRRLSIAPELAESSSGA
jgi:hypothetical protein